MAAESRLLDLTVSAEGVAAGVNQAKSFLASLVGDLGKASSAAIETNVKIRDAGAGVGRAFAGIAKELLPAADGLSRIARQVDAVTQAQERGAAGHRQAADMIGRLKDGLNVAQTGYVDLARAATQTEKAISSAYRSGKIGADEFKTSILATREAVYEQAAAVQRLADKERAQAQARIAQEREIKALAAERIAAEARAAAGQASVNRTLGVRHGPDLVGAARDDYAADVARLLAEQDQALSVASSKSQKLVNELLGVRYLAPLAAEVEADYAAFWGAIADKQDQAIVAAAGRSQKAVNELLGVRHFAPLAAEAEAEYAAFWSEVVGKQEQASVAAAGQSQKLVNELLGVRYLGSLGKQVERDYEATWERLLQEQEEATERAAQKAAEANAKLATSYKQVMASIDPAIAQQQKYDSALADLRAGAAAAGRSAEELAADEMRLAASMSPAALAAKKEADALEALKARADPASAALRRLAQDQAALDAAHAAGKLDPDEYTTYTAAIQRHRNIVEQSTASQKAMTNAVGLNKAQMQALAPQINDVVSGLIMGQPPMMIFTQQSGQIVQALQAGGAELPKFSLGMGVVAAGAVAVAAGLATAIYGAYRFTSDLREFERAVRLTGSATSITSHGLSEMAVQIAATQHISRAATREVATAYAATGKVGADVLGGLTAATKNWASATGQEVGDATKELAGLFVDPAKGADTLIDRYGLLDDSQRKLIRNYQAQGNLEQAQVVMLRAIEDRAEGAADRINKVAAAWERVKKWTSDKVDQVGERAVETISPSRDTEIRDLEASLAGSMWSGKRARKQARLDELRGEERDDAIKKWELGVRTEYNRLSAAAGDFARSVDPAIAASTNFANAEGLINRALDVGAVKKEEAARLLGLYRKQLLDSIDPAKAFADEMERQARVMEAAAGRARDFEIQRQQILQKPGRLSSDSLTPDETAKINAGLDRKYAAEAADRHRTAQEAIQDAKALGAATASLSQPALVAAQAQAVFFDVLRKTSDYKKAKQAEDDAYTKGMVEWSAQVDASVKTSVLAVDAARRLAEAQAQGGVIATAQAQAQNVHAEQVARGVDPVRALALANADYQKSLASLAGQQAAWNRDIGEQIEGAQRLARAEAVSGAAVAEANIQNKVRAQVLKEGVSAESARAQAIEAGTRALEAQNAVARVNASIRQGNQDLDLARAEFELLGRSNAERERTIAILKATLEVQNSGDWAQVPQETRDAWVAQAGAVAEYQARIADATETSRDFANVITQGFEDALVSGGKLGDLLKGLEADIKRIVVRGVITKPLETYLTGNLTKLLAGTPPGDSQVKPVTASDPGGYKALFDKLSGGAGALGSQSNPMWIRMSAGAPALDVSQFSGGAALPVAVQDGGAIVDAIRSEARAQGVPEEVALAIGRIESGLQQYRADGSVLRSSAGAMGVMQLMPGTAQWLGVDASDTRDNIRGGVKFLAQLGRQFGGDWSQVAGAYNAGPGRMTQYLQQGRALPAEAVTYIEKFGSSVQTANAAVVGLAAPVQSMAMAQTAQVRAQQAGATATQALSEGQQDAVSAALAAVRGMDAVRGTAEDVDARWSAVSDSSTTAVQKMADAQRRAADTMAGGAAVFASGAQQAGAYMVSGSQQAMGALISIIGAASGIQGGGIPGQVVQAGGPQGIASSIQQLGGVLQKATGSDLFGGGSLGGIKEWLNTPLYGGSGAVLNTGAVQQTAASLGSGAREMASASMPLSGSPGAGGVTAGDALGAVGYGFNAFQNFKSGNTIGGVGNLAATAMMFIPGAQPFAPLVAIGSQLLGGLFGKDRGTPTAAATVTYSGTNQVASSYNQDNDGSLEQAQQLLSSIDAATKQFITAASGATNGEFGIGVEGRDGRFKARTLTGELPGDFGSLDEAVIAGFKANVGKGLISASDDVLKAIGTSTKTDINEWLGDVSFAKTFRPQFDSLMANLDPVSNQIKTFTEASKQLGEQVQANIVEWRDTASRLGLATGSELTTAARRGIEAMMGLGPVTQPLVGMAAASKQAEIQFEAFRPALASLGYTAEEVADMATRYTAKLTTAYSDAVGLLQRQAGVQVSGLSGRGASLSAADTFRAAGATVEAVTAPAFAALTDGLDGLTAAARRGALTYADVEAGWRALNQAVYEGVLTADQYTTAVGLLTTAYQDSQTVLSTLRQGWTSVQAITEPHRQPTATDVLDGAMVRGGGAGVLAFATQLDGLFTAIQGGTASFGDLAYTYERAADLFRAGTITGEQFTGIVSSMTTAWTKAADAAKALTAYQSDLNSRMYTGVGAARTAGLLSLDQQQAVELAQARDAGYDTTLLQQVLASERGQKAFDLAKADVLGYYDQQISATQDLITSLQDGAVAAAAVARQFRQAYDSLALDDSSPLSAYEKLIEARRQFDEAYSTATSDTASDTEKTEAQQQLQQLGPTLVSLAQAYYANSNRDDYDRIRSLFDRLGTLPGGANPATADRDLQVAQDTLKELQRQRADAARLGERQYGKLDDLSATMNQSYAVWQASLVALQRLTNTPSAATLPQMLAGMTRETLPDVVTWAKAQGADTLQQVLVAADKRFGWENNPYRYRAPDDVATMEGTGFTSEDALGFLRQFGYAGGFDSNANAFIAAHGIGDQYTAFLRDFKARNSVEGKRTRLAAFTDAQIEAAFGGMADIQAARSVDPGFNLRRWFEAYGINEVLSGARSIPGFAKGTLSTPPGAKWVGEHGAELVWDGGGAAVASSADSMRIASLWESAANDRWSGPNIASLRAHRPEPSGDAALVAMLERKLDTVTAELKALRAERSRDARDQVALTEAAATETIAGQGRMLAALRLHHDEERAA